MLTGLEADQAVFAPLVNVFVPSWHGKYDTLNDGCGTPAVDNITHTSVDTCPAALFLGYNCHGGCTTRGEATARAPS